MIMARLPIVASAFPDLDAVITEHDIGTTFDERDPAAIAAAICGALESSAQAHWRAQLELAARRLCWEEESREYCACLAELAAPRAHR